MILVILGCIIMLASFLKQKCTGHADEDED